MSSVHKNYNLQFSNMIVGGQSAKVVDLLDQSVQNSEPLWFYLIQILYVDDVDLRLEEVNKAIQGLPFNDGIGVGSGTVNLTQTNVQIIRHGITTNIPTNDFKIILEEYKSFLQTPPLNGQKVR